MASDQIKKFLRGAAIAAVGAALAYVSATVIPALEVSGTSAVAIAILSMAVNGLKLILFPPKLEQPK
jgi:hypothetical protein